VSLTVIRKKTSEFSKETSQGGHESQDLLEEETSVLVVRSCINTEKQSQTEDMLAFLCRRVGLTRLSGEGVSKSDIPTEK